MSQGLEVDVKQIVISSGSFGPTEINQLIASIREDQANYRVLREAAGELEDREDTSPAAAVRLGVCYYLLGRYRKATEVLRKADGGAVANFYLGKSHFALQSYDEAIQAYSAAASANYDHDACQLGIAESLRHKDECDDALRTLDELSGAVEQTAEYLYQRGATIAALGVNPQEVVALYERAVEADPGHAGALFGLALENDRYGNDNTALELYQRSASQFPSHVGSLLNLGLLYEDRDQHDKAAECYQRILEIYPNHPQARLYLKDAQASGDMYYDEEAQRKRDRVSQILSIPVTDFELSVRSRNCLQKMGLNQLGDLTRTTEQELLASKNFGETSLIEIREMLASRGLELGMFADQRREVEPAYEPDSLSADERELFERPISDLNLSVRARKCMVRLGIATMGELLRRKADELLECKNFGVTSLNEVREKLTVMGLKLRGE